MTTFSIELLSLSLILLAAVLVSAAFAFRRYRHQPHQLVRMLVSPPVRLGLIALVVLIVGVAVLDALHLVQLASLMRDPSASSEALYRELRDFDTLLVILVLVLGGMLIAVFSGLGRGLASALERNRREIEHDIQQRETRFRRALDAVPEPILVLDAAGRIEMANRNARLLLRRASDKLIDVPFDHLLHPDDPDQRSQWHQALREPNLDEALPCQLQWPDGEALPVEVRMNPNRQNGEWQLVLVLHDLSGQRRSEHILRQNLRQAETVNRTQAAFLIDLARQVHTQGSRLLTDGAAEPNALGIELLNLSDRALDCAALRAQGLQWQAQPFALRALLQLQYQRWAPRAQARQLDFRLNVVETLPDMLMGDPLYLGLMLSCLLDNAIKFTEQGRIELRCRPLESLDEGMLRLRFEVADSGTGMDSEQLVHLLQPHLESQGEGGLVRCLRLSELLDGRIDVDSQPAHGTCVTLDLPFARHDTT